MAEVTLSELLERTRLESGLRTNAYYSDDQIIRYLNAGGAELYDLFTAANQHYVINQFNFTTTGQSDAIVDLPDDFQQGHSLEIYPDLPGQTITIKYLSNWLNRNAYGSNVFSLAPGGYYPCYTFLDNQLRFYPPQCTPAAPFRLYYTPMWVTLLPLQEETWQIGTSAVMLDHNRQIVVEDGDSVTDATSTWVFANGDFDQGDVGVEFTITSGIITNQFTIDTVVNSTTITTVVQPGVTGTFTSSDTLSIEDVSNLIFPNALFTDDMIGGTLVINFTDGVNNGFNGTYTIYDVLDPTQAQIRTVGFSLFTNPTAGTITVSWQPSGTRATLPNVMGPWSEYLVVYAAMAINIDRQQPIGELERKLERLKMRVSSIVGTRQEEPQQPPLTRGDFGGGPWGGGWGGW